MSSLYWSIVSVGLLPSYVPFGVCVSRHCSGSEHFTAALAVEAQLRAGSDEISDFPSAREDVLINACICVMVFQ